MFKWPFRVTLQPSVSTKLPMEWDSNELLGDICLGVKLECDLSYLRLKPGTSGLRSGLQIRSRSPSSLVCPSRDSSFTGGDNDVHAGLEESVRKDSLPLNSILYRIKSICKELDFGLDGNKSLELENENSRLSLIHRVKY